MQFLAIEPMSLYGYQNLRVSRESYHLSSTTGQYIFSAKKI